MDVVCVISLCLDNDHNPSCILYLYILCNTKPNIICLNMSTLYYSVLFLCYFCHIISILYEKRVRKNATLPLPSYHDIPPYLTITPGGVAGGVSRGVIDVGLYFTGYFERFFNNVLEYSYASYLSFHRCLTVSVKTSFKCFSH